MSNLEDRATLRTVIVSWGKFVEFQKQKPGLIIKANVHWKVCVLRKIIYELRGLKNKTKKTNLVFQEVSSNHLEALRKRAFEGFKVFTELSLEEAKTQVRVLQFYKLSYCFRALNAWKNYGYYLAKDQETRVLAVYQWSMSTKSRYFRLLQIATQESQKETNLKIQSYLAYK